jgi:hypothetical protein
MSPTKASLALLHRGALAVIVIRQHHKSKSLLQRHSGVANIVDVGLAGGRGRRGRRQISMCTKHPLCSCRESRRRGRGGGRVVARVANKSGERWQWPMLSAGGARISADVCWTASGCNRRCVFRHGAAIIFARSIAVHQGALSSPVVRADNRSLIRVLERRIEAVTLKINVPRVVEHVVVIVIVRLITSFSRVGANG